MPLIAVGGGGGGIVGSGKVGTPLLGGVLTGRSRAKPSISC